MKKYLQRTLFRSLLPDNEKLVLVRTRTSASYADYFLWIGTALVSILGVLAGCLVFLQLILSGQGWAAWRVAWLPFLKQFIGIRPEHASSSSLMLLGLCFLLLCLMVLAFAGARKSLRELRGLVILTKTQRAKTSVPQGPIIWKADPWIETEAISDPTLDDVLDFAKDKREIWKTAVEKLFQEYSPQQTPLASIRMDVTHQLLITLVGQNGKSVEMPITNRKQAELCAFLAFQPREEWIRRKTIMEKVYGVGKESSFSMDTKRLQADLNAQAVENGIIPSPEESKLLQESGSAYDKIRLLEQKKVKNESYWRLTPHCEVAIFSELHAAYQLAKQVEQTEVNLDARLKELFRLVQHYGGEKGLLGTYQHFQEAWIWSEVYYKRYRDQWLFLLKDTMKRIHTHIPGQPQTEQDLGFLRSMACLSGWAAQATNSLFASISFRENSETYLLNGMRYYHVLQDVENARMLYQNYLLMCRKRDPHWEPRSKLKDEWPEVIAWVTQRSNKVPRGMSTKARVGRANSVRGVQRSF